MKAFRCVWSHMKYSVNGNFNLLEDANSDLWLLQIFMCRYRE